MEKEIKERLMKCLKKINSTEEVCPYQNFIAKWKIKEIFAREFPEIKDEINKL